MVEICNDFGLKKYNVLSFVNKDSLLVSKYNCLYIYNLPKREFVICAQLPCSILTFWAIRFNIFSRIMRLEIIYGTHFFDDYFLVCFENFIYGVNIITGEVKRAYESKNGRRPLSITVLKSDDSFKDGAYFGEYFSNPRKNKVGIYRLDFNFKVERVYTFESGLIEHVHTLVYDKYRSCFWILTGDFLDSAAIWQVKSNFSCVLKIAGGHQKYRACVAFALEDGLLYATDSQYQKNSIRFLYEKSEGWFDKELANVNGPVIYGGQFKNYFLFNTSVEGISGDRSMLVKYFDRKIGPGILEESSHIIMGNLEIGFNTIFKCEKDFLPFVLFQFGAFTFPTGENLTDYLVVSPKALKSKTKTIILKYIS